MKRATLLFFSFFFMHVASGQLRDAFSKSAIQDSLYRQLQLYPQEKIHLHLDRNTYVPGEKIWFRAYVTDAVTHQIPTYSRYVYVELIDARDSLISRVMIHPNEGIHHGHLFLSEIVPEGYYTVRAYTRYMENLGDDYFFKKNIWISQLPSDQENKKRSENKKKNKHIKDDYEVSFYPEGGYLLMETLCSVAFKALNKEGYPEVISGKIVDGTGRQITEIKTQHAGMGLFALIPEQGQQYYLECQNQSGLKKRFELPSANTNAYSIHINQNQEKIYLSPRKSIGQPDIPLYILAHCRGELFYFSLWNNTKEFISFTKEQFPSGIIHFLLFDNEMNALSERLLFNKKEDQGHAFFSLDKTNYQARDKVTATIAIKDTENNSLPGSLSIAVTDDNDIAVDSSTTILSSLLLSSELKGYIESPAYYLQDNNETMAALDLLMMTHGWRRYAIPEVLKGNYMYPEKPFETTKEISGKVKSLLFGKPVGNSEIIFFSSTGDFNQIEADENGKFSLYDVEYPDSTTIFIQSLGRKGKPNVELIIPEESFPRLSHIPYHIQTAILEKESEEMADFIVKAAQRAKYDESMRVVHLNEVEITAKIIEKKQDPRLNYWANSGSDVTIDRKRIEQRHAQYVTDMLYGISGVSVGSNGSIAIRGGRGWPLVLIDGIPMEWPDRLNSRYDSPLEMVNINDVESIDVFKGPNAAIFGARGANGAISITTRRGEYQEDNKIRFNYKTLNPLGYQQPVEFYSPKYETPETKHLGNPDYRTTIFWKPDIIISDKEEAIFEFYTSDSSTTYSVVIEGLSSDGKIIRQVEKIVVK